MNPGNSWLRVLNVYAHEWGIVKRLYIFQFFQGAGIAFFFTSALAQFLERFPITELPWVMVLSAFLLWIAGVAYMRLEHLVKFRNFNLSVILVMAGSVLLLWLANYRFDEDWFFYLTLAWFNVLYMLNNLQFWGIAALLFDLRQSKRLFAVISAGDIPAKALGYSLALVIVPYTGAANLLLFGAFCMLASLPFFNAIARSGDLDHARHAHHPSGRQPIKKLVANIATNKYIRRIAFISLIASICIILINYGFYGEVKKANNDDVALASFIAFFYASLRIVAFVTKMVFTSRLTASLGIKQALFITPVGLLLLTAIIIAAGNFSTREMLIFYLFGLCSMIVDVLRTSFNSPVLLTLMQPLPTYERLRAHNIVKGIMDPFASFIAGGFLLVLFNLHNRVDLMFLCYVLLVLGVLWLIGVVLVNRQYLEILVKTVSSRYFSREEFNLEDDAIKEQVRNKMMTGTDLEVISILRMLNSRNDAASQELIGQLLFHPSAQVRLEALRLVDTSQSREGLHEKLDSLISSDTVAEVRLEAVKMFCRLAGEDWDLSGYYQHPDPEIRLAAITGMLGNSHEPIRSLAGLKMKGLLSSGERKDREKFLDILEQVGDEYEHPDHASLIDDPDPVIRNRAIAAVGKACGIATLENLFGQFPRHEKSVLAALYRVGDRVMPRLKEKILSEKTSDSLRQKLISLCGRIGGPAAGNLLLELLISQPAYSTSVIKALYRSRHVAGADAQKHLESIARLHIIYGVELLHMQQALKKNGSYPVLNNSLQLEIQEIREVLLCVFGCLYDREKINQVKHGLNARQKDSIANAMEIIELTVRKDIGRQFNLMFEAIDVDQRCDSLRSLFTEKQFEKVEHILSRILSEKPIPYYNWTKACSMYVSKKHEHQVDPGFYRKFAESENHLLKETALYASSITDKTNGKSQLR